MSLIANSTLPFAESTYIRDLEGLYLPWQAAEAPAPELLVLNEQLAIELGADPAALGKDLGLLLGTSVPEGLTTVAQGYAGHQFGNYQPKLGDGRALLLGEVVDRHDERRDLHLKGSGRTPFSRGGDGKALIGPMLREHVIGEAMHALGIPTTRALAVVATGEQVRRETPLPGAVLVRVAASHLRVGTFQFAAFSLRNDELLKRLTFHTINRHYPDALKADVPALALFEAVVEAQAKLIAQWMGIGFVHGVMNTDNMALSGESIDFGPCAFMEAYDPETVFSSIDHGGRYAYGRQPAIAAWNLARLGESLLPVIDDDQERGAAAATEILETFSPRFLGHWNTVMSAKLGLADVDQPLVEELLALMQSETVDWTAGFRALSSAARGDVEPFRALCDDPFAADTWLTHWRGEQPDADAMDAVNPAVIPRNHLVDDALTQATVGNLEPYRALVAAVSQPFTPAPGYADPAPPDAGDFVTYCGT